MISNLLIIVLISLSLFMSLQDVTCQQLKGSWPGRLTAQQNAAALPIASVAVCIFKRIQAIWNLFIVLQMTHNGNLACDERIWITDRGHETGINLHLIFFKEDI